MSRKPSAAADPVALGPDGLTGRPGHIGGKVDAGGLSEGLLCGDGSMGCVRQLRSRWRRADLLVPAGASGRDGR